MIRLLCYWLGEMYPNPNKVDFIPFLFFDKTSLISWTWIDVLESKNLIRFLIKSWLQSFETSVSLFFSKWKCQSININATTTKRSACFSWWKLNSCTRLLTTTCSQNNVNSLKMWLYMSSGFWTQLCVVCCVYPCVYVSCIEVCLVYRQGKWPFIR